MAIDVFDEFGKLKTLKQIEKEEEQRQQMLDDLVGYLVNAFLYFFRWPFAPIWRHRQPGYFFTTLPLNEKFEFVCLLVLGALVEIAALWFSIGERMWYVNWPGPLGHTGFAVMAWACFMLLTVGRMIVWHEREWKDSPT